jgi:hypothetical protein
MSAADDEEALLLSLYDQQRIDRFVTEIKRVLADGGATASECILSTAFVSAASCAVAGVSSLDSMHAYTQAIYKAAKEALAAGEVP